MKNNNYQRIILFFILMFIGFLLVGCNFDDDTTNDVFKEELEEVSNMLLEDIDRFNVTENIELPTQIGDVVIAWKSSNEAVLSSTGVVERQEEDTFVTLTATLIKDKTTISTDISIRVIAKEDESPKVLTVSEAVAIAFEFGENGTTEEYYVAGTIVKVTNPTYGEMYITDGNKEMYVYGATGVDGTFFNQLEDRPYAGDSIVLLGIIKTFKDEPEMGRSKIIEFTHNEIEFNEDEYKEATIKEARNAEEADKLKVTGVVAAITYANGMIPNGFYLVDSTSSIYVYGDAVQRVAVGNKVTICGEKTYYVLSTEIDNAKKFGYKGCCQLQNGVVVENDNGNNAFDRSWIEETTVKELIETPVTENVTTLIYKVNALVKRVEGTGFVNYYFNDLDDATGSYVYTGCNGSDFEWLDEFDGKICTVYLTNHNCKATNSDCFFRFIPIVVEYDNFKFEESKTAEHVVKYYGVDQFMLKYNNDPQLELISEVSSELLGFNNAKLTYSSSDNEIVYFEDTENKIIMHTKNVGTAVVTIKCEYAGITYEQTIEITVEQSIEVDGATVKAAIDSADDSTVTVKGIIVSSLVNQTGFYIGDETGIIAVTCDASLFSEIKLGNLVVIEGTKTHKKKDPAASYAGQAVITNANLVTNYYGTHEYSTSFFVEDKTLEEIIALENTTDYTTTVFKFNATVVVEDTGFYSNIYIKSLKSNEKLILYTSSSNQYSWLKQFAGKEVTFEVMLCDWNSKGHKGCVISATCEGTKIINSLNFK